MWTGPSKTFRSPRAGPVSTGSVETLCSLCILEMSNGKVHTPVPMDGIYLVWADEDGNAKKNNTEANWTSGGLNTALV